MEFAAQLVKAVIMAHVLLIIAIIHTASQKLKPVLTVPAKIIIAVLHIALATKFVLMVHVSLAHQNRLFALVGLTIMVSDRMYVVHPKIVCVQM